MMARTVCEDVLSRSPEVYGVFDKLQLDDKVCDTSASRSR